MTYSSLLSRLRSSSKPIRFIKNTFIQTKHTPIIDNSNILINSNKKESWLTSLLPIVVAVSGGSLAFQMQKNQSLCDAPNLQERGVRIGGKDSTEHVVKGTYKPVPPELINELKAICQDNMTLDYDERYFHGKPQYSFHKAVNIPDVVVFPRSEEEVSKIVRSCNKYKVPIVPYGGATSIEGHTLSPNGGVCIDMTLMKSVKALHVKDMDVVVEPGIGWMELNEYLAPYGLFFPLDPGPGATIGGMCATRCSGSLAVRYGTMRDNVINLKAVLADGEVVKTASRARKSAAGYDLTRLMIGSEGTLGVITEVTLRLQKIPEHSIVAMCNFPTVKDAADVAIAAMMSGIQVSRVELLDEVQVKAVNLANGKDLPEAPTLMFEFIGTEAYTREQTLIVQKIASEHSGSDFVFAEDPEAKKELWKIRKEALYACLAMAPGYEAMTTDVCVPLSHLAELISKSKEELDASPLLCTVIAHAGDGNFHTVMLFDPADEDQRKEAERLNNFMVHAALSMEGTCTGEHGVGTGKVKYLEKELGKENLRTMKKIKDVLDPNGIMNPGKLIPPHICLVGGKDSKEHVVKGSYKPIPPELVTELKAICQDNMTLDHDERDFHGRTHYSFHKSVNIPDVVVFPRSEDEVSKIVQFCNKYKVSIVPYGGATSLEGQTLSLNGGVCIDMTLMKNVKALHVKDMDVVVEPGIGWMDLNEYLAPHGLFFPLDPGPGATIGGMCGTRCSGSLAVRYGTMRDNVISLKAVLADGEVVKTASRARKSAAGYDLTRLMIGSEGTLGVITEVTLRLQKIPEHSIVATCNFPTVKDAADVAIAAMLSGIQLSRVELLDELNIKAINLANGKDLPEYPTLMFEFIGTEAYTREQTLIVQKIASEHSGSDFVFAEDPEAKKELWKDVCVPLSHLAELISKSKEELDASPLLGVLIAHAGDGNFHTAIFFDPAEEGQRKEAERLNDFMVHAALAMEGTCTGEHGVGTGKLKYLEKELGNENLRTMKKIKDVLDPNGIMNPGKLIPPHICL
ncbi:FAD-linked oxidases family protein [Artemisia annua]|uniref:D-lactate dehydrogenase (cytochrome) n=1 Tax=Artemisia annua TaxID=35608 RepID=A0A2U1P4J4_ARTAN|nr:FAD-linked oxidases family protein [Artemisia annua]